jgi:HEAT repeat protein
MPDLTKLLDNLPEWVRDALLLLAGATGGVVLMLFREVLANALKALGRWLMDLIRGKRADAGFEERYLRWLESQTKGITLIGILPSSEERMPLLEQLFVVPRLAIWERRHVPAEIQQAKEAPVRETPERMLSPGERRFLGLSEILGRYQNLVVLGEPGSGKSTLLRFLALAFARGLRGDRSLLQDSLKWRQEMLLPVLLPLRLFADSEKGLADFLEDYLKEASYGELGAPEGFFERQMKQRRCLFLLDGLDEVTDPEEHREVAKRINYLATPELWNRFVVTSRVAGWRGLLSPDFPLLEIQPFDPGQVDGFVRKWYDAVERNAVVGEELPEEAKARERRAANRAQDLSRSIVGSDRLRRLAANPLLLSVMAMVHRVDVVLPRERAKLYERCTDLLLHKWDEGRGVEDQEATGLTLAQKQALMRRLAYRLHEQGARHAPRREMEHLIAEALPGMGQPPERARELLEWLERRSGLIADGERPTFAHLAFQEYFAAQAILGDEGKVARLLKSDRLFSDWWREVILLYAGMVEDATDFIARVYRPEDEDLFHSRLLLAGRCFAEVTQVELKLREQIIGEVVQLFLTAPYGLTRTQVASILVEISSTNIANLLVPFLLPDETIDLNVRASIVTTLCRLGDRATISQLLALLPEEKINWLVRGSIAAAVGDLRDKTVVPQLVALLPDDKIDLGVRANIVAALGAIGDKTVVSQLVAFLPDEKIDGYLREQIAQVLGQLGDKSTILQLLILLASKKIDLSGRRAMYLALWQLEQKIVLPFRLLMFPLEILFFPRQIISSMRCFLLGHLLEQLGLRALGRQVQAAVLADENVDSLSRWSIVTYLERSGGKSVVPHFLALLPDGKIDWHVRWGIASAVGRLGDKAVAPQLLGLLCNEKIEPNVRQSIASAVGRLGGKDVAPELLDLLADEKIDRGVREGIAGALGQMGNKAIIPQLMALLPNEKINRDVRWSIADALSHLGDKAIVRQLLDMLFDDGIDWLVRWSAALALGELAGDEGTVVALAKSLPKAGNIAEAVYRALYQVSRRARVRVMADERVVRVGTAETLKD